MVGLGGSSEGLGNLIKARRFSESTFYPKRKGQQKGEHEFNVGNSMRSLTKGQQGPDRSIVVNVAYKAAAQTVS